MESSFQQRVAQERITELKAELTGDLFQDLEKRDEIHRLEMTLNGVEAASGDQEDCLFCGS